MFIFALIAAARSVVTFLTVGWPVWIAAGFVAWAADQVLGDRLHPSRTQSTAAWRRYHEMRQALVSKGMRCVTRALSSPRKAPSRRSAAPNALPLT